MNLNYSINYQAMNLMIIGSVLVLLLSMASSLQIDPLMNLNETNFKATVKCDLETFMLSGSPDNTIWFFIFTTQGCQYCQQAEALLFSTEIEYRGKFHLDPTQANKTLENNIKFAQIDCTLSPTICDRFNVPYYPYITLMNEKGEACSYEGGMLPNQILDYLKMRKEGNKYEQCKFIGKIDFSSKMLGYLQPITKMINQNSLMFMLAFMIGPFLFGFVFSRNKKKETVPSLNTTSNVPTKAEKEE